MFGEHNIPSLGQIFDLYLDMNEIKFDDERWKIKNQILEYQYNNIITFHRYGFLFYYFNQLVKGEISHEQFITMGDIEGQIEDQINPHIYREEHPVYLTSLTPDIVNTWTKDDLVIVDENLMSYYEAQYDKIKSDAKIVVL